MAAVLRQHFLIMKVNYSTENSNAEFLQDYPTVPAYPHFFVLESDGRFLHSQGTAELEEGRGYNESVFLAFLEKWQPAAQPSRPAKAQDDNAAADADAEKLLADGLARARTEDKRVLIHLSAPS